MATEPNEKIENLLKRYVEQRKAEARADFELHPATRTLLQGEVARTFAKGAGQPKKSFFAFWPRLAVIGAFTAMFVLTVMVLNTPKERDIEMAQSSVEETPVLRAPSVAEQSKSAADLNFEKRDLAKKEIQPQSRTQLEKKSTTERKIPGQSGIATDESVFDAKRSESLGLAPAEKNRTELWDRNVPAENASTETFARSASEPIALDATAAAPALTSTVTSSVSTYFYAETDLQTRWQFVQQDLRAKYRQNLLSPAQPKVLESFELARTGNKIRMIDTDGSIYEGEILAAAQDKLNEKETRNPAERNSDFAFRVAGTNQRLNRAISFVGKFVATNKNTDLTEKTLARKDTAFQSGDLKKQKISRQSGLVEGKVSIGGTNEFEIQAAELPK